MSHYRFLEKISKFNFNFALIIKYHIIQSINRAMDFSTQNISKYFFINPWNNWRHFRRRTSTNKIILRLS